VLSTYLTWFLLALIPAVPVILALFPGLDEPRNEDDTPPPDRDDTRLDDPPAVAGQDEAGPVLMAV
jgi:hypothetical protein